MSSFYDSDALLDSLSSSCCLWAVTVFFSYLPSQKEIHGEGQTRECNFDESPVLKGFGTSHVSCASEASIGLGIL